MGPKQVDAPLYEFVAASAYAQLRLAYVFARAQEYFYFSIESKSQEILLKTMALVKVLLSIRYSEVLTTICQSNSKPLRYADI